MWKVDVYVDDDEGKTIDILTFAYENEAEEVARFVREATDYEATSYYEEDD